MTTTEGAIQAIRAALKTLSGWGDSRVLVAESGATVPAQSYFTVLAASKIATEHPDVLFGSTADPDVIPVSIRQRSDVFLTVRGFGSDTEAILSRFVRECRTRFGIGTALIAAGVGIYNANGPVEVGRAVDTAIEPRWRLTIDAYISETSSVAAIGALETADLDLDLTSSIGDVEATIVLTYP